MNAVMDGVTDEIDKDSGRMLVFVDCRLGCYNGDAVMHMLSWMLCCMLSACCERCCDDGRML